MTIGLTNSFGGYTALTTTSTAQNKTDINANLDKLAALFQQEGPSNNTTGAGNVPVYPDFAIIPQQAASQIKAEIAALKAIISASP